MDNPDSLTYSNSFGFKFYTSTPSLQVPSDGNVTVTLTDAYMNFNSSGKPTVYVEARYWNGAVWIAAKVSPASVKVSKTKNTYTFHVSGLKRNAFYIKLSKNEYVNYRFKGNISVAD